MYTRPIITLAHGDPRQAGESDTRYHKVHGDSFSVHRDHTSIPNHRICRTTTMTADTIFVDEDVGRDNDAAFGTAATPYKTPPHAMISHSPTTTFMTRKSQTGPVSADGDPSARLEWKPASQSALKKATKLII